MSKKFRLLMVLVLVTGLFGGLLTGSTVSADPTPGTFIEIPRIDVGDVFGTGDWDTQIQIMNLGVATTVSAKFYGGDPFVCPPNADGSFYDVEMWMPAGGVWTLHNAIPAGAESAFIGFPVGGAPPQPLAVTVDRWGPDAYGDELELSASYTGIADPDMVGPGPPFEYFAPYVMNSYHNLDATITIQNSDEDLCASIWIYYKKQGNCEFMKAQHIEQIAPGERIVIGNGPDADMAYPLPELAAPWLGSAYITANVPLAVIVDQLSFAPSLNQGTLLSMRGMPYLGDPREDTWEEIWYADLLYREISGWQSSIQVQNLTVRSVPTFVTVEFFDQSGDSILFVGDWVCRNGSKTFYLPAIIDLGVNFPFGYVGAAEIMSHGQVDYPGDWHDGEPIFAVVDIKKTKIYDNTMNPPQWRHTFPGETQAGSYNAHPWWQKQNANGWAMPYIAKEQEGVTSRIAIRNNANCNKIKGYIEIVDETGNTVTIIPVPWLHPKHMKIVDLAYFGTIARGFVGAAKFEVSGIEQLCDIDGNGITDLEPVMPSVVVLNYGYATELPIGSGAGPWTQIGGDVTRVYEGIPFDYRDVVGFGEIRGLVVDECTLLPAEGVNILLDGEIVTSTDSNGWYGIEDVEDGDHTVEASKVGYKAEDAQTVTVVCGEIATANFEMNPLVSPVEVSGLVVDCTENDMRPIDEATVTLDGLSTETTSAGSYVIGGDFAAGTYDITASKDDFYDCTQEVVVPECGDDFLRDFELNCIAPLLVTVKDDCTYIDLQETLVEIDFSDKMCCDGLATGTDSGTTDSNGEVTLEATKGTVKVTVSKEGYNTFEGEKDLECAGGTLEVSLWPKAWVKGQVFQDAQDTTGLEDVDVKLVDLASGDHWYNTTNATGWYNHYNVEPGWYVLRYYVAGVAKCESAPFEIFASDASGAIDRVEATVWLDSCEFEMYGYNCGDLVRWTGKVLDCDTDLPIKDATGTVWITTDENGAPKTADWATTGYTLTTKADGRVKFEDPTFPAPDDGWWYQIRFTKTTHQGGALDKNYTEYRRNMNGSTMWFGWPVPACLYRIP